MPRRIRFVRTNVAGYLYTQGFDLSIHYQLTMGDRLRLVREPGNPHDSNAVAIYTKGDIKLGYIPRNRNAYFALLLDLGLQLECMILGIMHAVHPCQMVHIGIEMGDEPL